MSPRPRPILAVFSLLALSLPASAEGLVQFTLNGEIDTPGGALVEIHVGFWDGEQVVPVDLHLHLAERTSARDVAHLLVSRLRAARSSVLFPGEQTDERELAQIFIEDTTLLSFRLGHGLWATVTTCESGPESLRFRPPLEIEKPAGIAITVTTFLAHTKTPGRIQLIQDAEAGTSGIDICRQLFDRGLEKGLVGDRPDPDLWRAVKTESGGVVTGCSVTLRAEEGDWGMEVRLRVPEP